MELELRDMYDYVERFYYSNRDTLKGVKGYHVLEEWVIHKLLREAAE